MTLHPEMTTSVFSRIPPCPRLELDLPVLILVPNVRVEILATRR